MHHRDNNATKLVSTCFGICTQQLVDLQWERDYDATAGRRSFETLLDLQEHVAVHPVCMVELVPSLHQLPIRATVPTLDSQELIAKVRCKKSIFRLTLIG